MRGTLATCVYYWSDMGPLLLLLLLLNGSEFVVSC